MNNWLAREGENPFNLLSPPHWWLRQLALRDADLVVFPSAKDAKYRLGRRVKNSYGLQVVGKLHQHPDTTFMAANGLIPVISFLATIEWTTEIFTMLSLMDMWSLGGAEATADHIEQTEAVIEAKKNDAFESDVNDLSADAYRAAKMRLGQRTFVTANAPSRSSEQSADRKRMIH